MIHWAPLSIKSLIWCGTIVAKRSLPISVSWSCHLVLCSPRLGSLRSTFMYMQLLNFMCLVFIYRPGHVITKSYTSHSFLLVLALLCLFGGRASCRLGRRFVCKEFLGSTLFQNSIKYPMSTAQSRLAKMVHLMGRGILLVTCPIASSLCHASSFAVVRTP